MVNANSKNIPGKKGAIARLIILGLVAVIGILAGFGTLPEYVQKRGLGLAILEAFGGTGVIFLLGAFFWILIKWIGFMAPKSFGFAKRFWLTWHPLTFFGLYLKAVLWLIIAVAPCSAITLLFSPLMTVTMYFAEVNIDFLSAMALFIGSGALVVALAFVDICKLRQVSAMAVVKEKLAFGK